jgi:hypothetical protein
MTLSIEGNYAECRYAKCRDYLNVTLSVVMLNVAMSVVMLNVAMSVFMLNVAMSVLVLNVAMSVFMLNVAILSVISPRPLTLASKLGELTRYLFGAKKRKS